MKMLKISLTPPIVAISAMFLVLTGSVRAEIPTTLEPGTAYVVNCETGNAPAKIYVENASLTLENHAWLECTDMRSASGTNFTLHLTGESVMTNYINIAPGNYAHVVVDEGSVLWWKSANTPCSAAGNRFNVFAFTNATFFMSGNTSLYGHDNTLLMHNTTVLGGQTLQIGGKDNVCAISGTSTFPSGKTLAVFNGTNTWVRIADNTLLKVNNGGKIQSYTDGTNGFYVGKNAYLYFGSSGLYSANTARHGRIIVDEGGELSVANGDGGGILGIDYQWITTNGTFSCSNNMVRVGDKLTDVDCRLVLVGDKAKFYVRNFSIGNASSNGTLTVVLRPGPTGYNGAAPIWSTTGGSINGGVFDIDMREAMQQVEPGEVYRLPVARTWSAMTLTVATLEKLNLTAKLLPEDAQLVKEGNILYCVARRQKGLMILVR